MNCIFVRTGQGNELKCERADCGNHLYTDDPPWRCFAECRSSEAPGPSHDGPSFFRKAANFAAAALKQAPLFMEATLTGDETKAIRSETEIEAIVKICRSCEHFDPEKEACRICGCPIDEERSAYLSKVAWRSAHCPLDTPKW